MPRCHKKPRGGILTILNNLNNRVIESAKESSDEFIMSYNKDTPVYISNQRLEFPSTAKKFFIKELSEALAHTFYTTFYNSLSKHTITDKTSVLLKLTLVFDDGTPIAVIKVSGVCEDTD